MRTTRVEGVRRRLHGLSRAGLAAPEYAQTALDLLRQSVPFDSACLATSDPATGLMTGTVKVDLPDARDEEFAHFEYEVDDINLYRDLCSRADPVGVLALDTAGDPQRSPRWRDFLRPHFGYEDEMRAALRADRAPWGLLGLYRGGGGGFSPAEAAFVGEVSSVLGSGLRASLVSGAAAGAAEPSRQAVVVVDDLGRLRCATPEALRHLRALGSPDGQSLPVTLVSLIAAARAFRQGRIHIHPRVRIRTATAGWLVLDAAPLLGPDGAAADIAVTISRAGAHELAPLLVAALGLTDREQQIAAAVLAGESTQQISERLFLSPYTVQDHLKSIFAKAGVRSRRELMARVFFDQYAPRMGADLAPSGWFA